MIKPTDPLTREEHELVEREARDLQVRIALGTNTDLDLDVCRMMVLQKMLEDAVQFETDEFHRMTNNKYR